jgi:hypothetical protein
MGAGRAGTCPPVLLKRIKIEGIRKEENKPNINAN